MKVESNWGEGRKCALPSNMLWLLFGVVIMLVTTGC